MAPASLICARRPAASVLTVGAVVWLLCVCPAAAYVDPGGGSYFFQLLIAGLTTVIFFANRARDWLGKLFTRKSSEQDPPKDLSVPPSDHPPEPRP